MVIGERIYYGIYQWSYLRLDLDVLYIRHFDPKMGVIGQKNKHFFSNLEIIYCGFKAKIILLRRIAHRKNPVKT
jgi:hypothetical protein